MCIHTFSMHFSKGYFPISERKKMPNNIFYFEFLWLLCVLYSFSFIRHYVHLMLFHKVVRFIISAE